MAVVAARDRANPFESLKILFFIFFFFFTSRFSVHLAAHGVATPSPTLKLAFQHS